MSRKVVSKKIFSQLGESHSAEKAKKCQLCLQNAVVSAGKRGRGYFPKKSKEESRTVSKKF